MKARRNKPGKQRTVPCQFCGYPISQRHHALPFRAYGENVCTLQLCANCHELYHILEKAYLKPTPQNEQLLKAFVEKFGADDIRIHKAAHFIAAAIRIARGEYPVVDITANNGDKRE